MTHCRHVRYWVVRAVAHNRERTSAFLAANSSDERMPFLCNSASRSIFAKRSVSWVLSGQWQLDPNLTNVEPRNASVKKTGNREGRERCPQGARRGLLTDHLGRAPFARATKFDPTPWCCPFIPLFPTL